MTRVNENFLKLPGNYLFSDIAHKVAEFRDNNPDRRVISLGIGDVTRPLAPAVIEALHMAVNDMADPKTFHGYGPEQGYSFLRDVIMEYDYREKGITISPDEIFISDGAKSDVGNFQELFDGNCVVAVTDPVYPVYVDSNVMSGRAGDIKDGQWSKIVYLPCIKQNNFEPPFPDRIPDIIYLCYPNNPTGTVLSRECLQKWVDYAHKNGCVILYDSAYEAFIREDGIPHSIYELDGARDVAVEFRSFSKTAGFTGLRCAYTVVPKDLKIPDGHGGNVVLNSLWNRRQCTKYNGCAYIVQKAAAAIYTEPGRRQTRDIINGYLLNAAKLRSAVTSLGLDVFGGINAPYIWVGVPSGMTSWSFFELLLNQAALVCTPGVGFGPNGEGYVRLTSFGSPEDTDEAIKRMNGLSDKL